MSGETAGPQHAAREQTAPIPRAILEQIYRQARAEFPSECCGYLRGRGAETIAVPCANVMDTLHARDPDKYPRTSRNGYHFSVRDFQAFDASFAAQPPATVIYHSHPRVGAYFSDEDARLALAFSEMGYDVDYLVIDAQEDGVREALLFRRDGERFRQIARYDGFAVTPDAERDDEADAEPSQGAAS